MPKAADYDVLPVADPLTLALALNDMLTFAEADAAAVAWAPKVASSPAQARPAEVSWAVTLAIPSAIPVTAVAATLNCPTETWINTGKLVSRVVFKAAEAVPERTTLIAGLVQVALNDAELSQPATPRQRARDPADVL